MPAQWYPVTRWLQNNPMPMLIFFRFWNSIIQISEIQPFSHYLTLGKDNAQRAKVFTAKQDYVLNFSSASRRKAALAFQSCRFASMAPFSFIFCDLYTSILLWKRTKTLMEGNMHCTAILPTLQHNLYALDAWAQAPNFDEIPIVFRSLKIATWHLEWWHVDHFLVIIISTTITTATHAIRKVRDAGHL